MGEMTMTIATKNAKKKRVPGTTATPAQPTTTKTSEVQSKKTATPATVATKKTPARPAPPVKLPKTTEGKKANGKKEEVKQAIKQEPKQKPEARKSTEASKPIVTSERPNPPAEPRPAHTRTTSPDEPVKHEEQVSVFQMRELSYKAKQDLFKRLNKGASEDRFITLLKPSVLPKKLQMRLDEAKLRNLVEAKPSNKEALYCGYCVDWQPFHYHAWTGYRKCCGCSMSTKDFYIAVDNGIFGKE
jgi:hypothetical protein